jgi:primosomal protein N'
VATILYIHKEKAPTRRQSALIAQHYLLAVTVKNLLCFILLVNQKRICATTVRHCVYCGGWRMRTLGIASSGIETLLTHSGLKVFVIDGERTRTKKQVEEVYKNWQKEPLALLIGTELALNMLTECDGITIASLDSLFSLPEYTVDERIVSIIVDCRQKTKGPVYLQTRMRKNPLFSHITDYSFLKYYTWALEERKSLHLPPFYTIIKGTFLTISELEKEKITAFLTKQKLEHVWFEAGGQKLLLFIHIENSIWATHEEIRNELVQLCAHATLEVNPESFFS